MIDSKEQAERVQRRRHDAGLKGYAKAVKRYFSRIGDKDGYRSLPALSEFEAWHPKYD